MAPRDGIALSFEAYGQCAFGLVQYRSIRQQIVSLWRSPGDAALVTAITAVAIVLRAFKLGSQSLDYDEAVRVHFARLSWIRFIRSIPLDPAMISYNSFLHLWMSLGTSEVMIRVPSLVFSAATVPVIYFLGRRLLSSRVGIVAAALFAFHAFSIRYAQEARSYSLTGLLIAISCLYFLKAIEWFRLGDWLAYVFASVFAAYAHFFAVFALAAQWVFLLVVRPRILLSKPVIVIGIIVGIVSAAVAIPIFVIARTTRHWRWIPGNSIHSTALVIFSLSGWPFGVRGLAAGALAAFYFAGIVAALIACGQSWRRSREQAAGYLFLAIGTLLPIALVFAGSLIHPMVVARYFVLLLPLLVLLVAAGVCQIRPVRILTLVTVIVLLFEARGTVTYYKKFHKADVRDAVRFVVANLQSGDAITPDYRINRQFDYYFDRANKQGGVRVLRRPNLLPLSTDAAALEARRRLVANDCCHDPRRWVIALDAKKDAPKGASDWTMLEQALQRGYGEIHRRQFGRGIEVLLFTSPRSTDESGPVN